MYGLDETRLAWPHAPGSPCCVYRLSCGERKGCASTGRGRTRRRRYQPGRRRPIHRRAGANCLIEFHRRLVSTSRRRPTTASTRKAEPVPRLVQFLLGLSLCRWAYYRIWAMDSRLRRLDSIRCCLDTSVARGRSCDATEFSSSLDRLQPLQKSRAFSPTLLCLGFEGAHSILECRGHLALRRASRSSFTPVRAEPPPTGKGPRS